MSKISLREAWDTYDNAVTALRKAEEACLKASESLDKARKEANQ